MNTKYLFRYKVRWSYIVNETQMFFMYMCLITQYILVLLRRRRRGILFDHRLLNDLSEYDEYIHIIRWIVSKGEFSSISISFSTWKYLSISRLILHICLFESRIDSFMYSRVSIILNWLKKLTCVFYSKTKKSVRKKKISM